MGCESKSAQGDRPQPARTPSLWAARPDRSPEQSPLAETSLSPLTELGILTHRRRSLERIHSELEKAAAPHSRSDHRLPPQRPRLGKSTSRSAVNRSMWTINHSEVLVKQPQPMVSIIKSAKTEILSESAPSGEAPHMTATLRPQNALSVQPVGREEGGRNGSTGRFAHQEYPGLSADYTVATCCFITLTTVSHACYSNSTSLSPPLVAEIPLRAFLG